MIVFNHMNYQMTMVDQEGVQKQVNLPFIYLFGQLSEQYMIMKKNLYSFVLFGGTPASNCIILNKLFPKEEYVSKDAIFYGRTESDFDYMYWKQLLEDKETFEQVLQILRIEYFEGPNAVISIQMSDDHSGLTEVIEQSLQLFFREIFGLAPSTIMNYEDLIDFVANIDNYPNGFSSEGLERVTKMIQDADEAILLVQGNPMEV